MGQFSKKWEDLTIADNFIFCKVMEDEKICKGVLETLLEIKVNRIDYLRTENPIDNFYDSRGIRLDVYVKDSDKIYNIEMQAGNYDDILLRARYYLSSSDVATTRRRTKFRNIKETYILFICKDDPFGCGIPRYTRFSKFLETDEIPYNDKIHIVFYNCSAWEKESDLQIRNVLKFIYGFKADSGIAREMEGAVSTAKRKSDIKDEYMYFSDILEEEIEEARETGLAEGRELGLKQGRELGLEQGRELGIKQGRELGLEQGRELGLEQGRELGREQGHKEGLLSGRTSSARNAISLGLSDQQAAAISGLSIEEVRKLAEEINNR